jgi:hypothetical protein
LRLETGGVLSGDYRWNGHELYVTQPNDFRYRGLKWEWASEDNENEMVLVAEPPDHPSGATYMGARLKYLGEKAPPVVTETRVLRSFSPNKDTPISRDGLAVLQAERGSGQMYEAWIFKATDTRTFDLFDVESPDVTDCILKFNASMRTTDVKGQAYLELVCQPTAGEELVSRGYHQATTGTTESWKDCEPPLLLPAGQRSKVVKLRLVIEDGGTVSLKDVSLNAAPLPNAGDARK